MSLARFGSAQDALFLHNHDLWFVIQHFVYRSPSTAPHRFGNYSFCSARGLPSMGKAHRRERSGKFSGRTQQPHHRPRLSGFVRARLHGQRHAASYRRAGCFSREAGGLILRRLRLCNADGRFHHARAAEAVRKDSYFQQRHTRLR